MILDLGVVKPGSTLRIPFNSFDKDDGSSITMTNYAAADILVYKDGGTTERASTAGFTATTDFDSKTGKHFAIIDLADNTTAGFFGAGSEYHVAIDAVTIDGVTTGGWIARFRIGYPQAHLDTTIATLASQLSGTLTAGPAEDDALRGALCIIHDIASAVQCSYAIIVAYTGSTKTFALLKAPTFTVAAGDNISIVGFVPLDLFGVVSAGALTTSGGSTTAGSFPAGQITKPAVGHIIVVPSLGDAKRIKTYNSGSGAWTVDTGDAFRSDPNALQYYVVAVPINLPLTSADFASDALALASFASDVKARLLASTTVTRQDAREGVGGSITIGAGAHTNSSVLASNASNGTALKGRLGVVISGGVAKRLIRFAGDAGASGAFLYTDSFGNANPEALQPSDVVQY